MTRMPSFAPMRHGRLRRQKTKAPLTHLIARALNDSDIRVRVSAIRTLGTLKDARATPALIDRGNILVNRH